MDCGRRGSFRGLRVCRDLIIVRARSNNLGHDNVPAYANDFFDRTGHASWCIVKTRALFSNLKYTHIYLYYT